MYHHPLNRLCYPSWYSDEDIHEANMKLAKEKEAQGNYNTEHLYPRKIYPSSVWNY